MKWIACLICSLAACALVFLGLANDPPVLVAAPSPTEPAESPSEPSPCLDVVAIGLTATPSKIALGQSSTVSWSVEGGDGCAELRVRLNGEIVVLGDAVLLRVELDLNRRRRGLGRVRRRDYLNLQLRPLHRHDTASFSWRICVTLLGPVALDAAAVCGILSAVWLTVSPAQRLTTLAEARADGPAEGSRGEPDPPHMPPLVA